MAIHDSIQRWRPRGRIHKQYGVFRFRGANLNCDLTCSADSVVCFSWLAAHICSVHQHPSLWAAGSTRIKLQRAPEICSLGARLDSSSLVANPHVAATHRGLASISAHHSSTGRRGPTGQSQALVSYCCGTGCHNTNSYIAQNTAAGKFCILIH
jgi:hypothetical protein